MTRVHATQLNAIVLAVVFSIVAVPVVSASVPTEMTVQGKLTDPGGAPVTIAVTLIFRIFDAPAGGTDVWTGGVGEPHSVTPDAEGLWTERIGVSTALTDAVFSGAERWLEITVDDGPGGNPTETLARTKLNTNPYTYRSSTVDGASGGTISGDITVSAGDIVLEPSSPTTGNIRKGANQFIHDYGVGNTFVGNSAGNFTSTGQANTAIGTAALTSNTTGLHNTAAGYHTLLFNTTGGGNAAFGSEALEKNTGGFANTAVGQVALKENTTGNSNTGLGNAALISNTTGSSNTATGYSALNRNTTGSFNTATGFSALFENTTGTQNTACGERALNFNTTGSRNLAAGSLALRNNTTGYENAASGAGALFSNTTGFYNTAHGADALYFNTTGFSNTACGQDALTSNTTGSENTACGDGALYSNSAGSYNSANGFNALLNNTTGGGNTATGHNSLHSNTTGADNTSAGTEALFGNTTGSGNTASGFRALNNNITGINLTAIGINANVSTDGLFNATALGAEATVDASNKIRLGNTFVTVIEGQVAYTFTSDKNQKENFQPVDGVEVLNKLADLELSSWNYKGQDPQRFRHYGPMAQEFYEAFGHDGVGSSGTPTTINSGDQAGILMIAVQAQQRQIEDLKAQVQELQRMVVERQK